MYRKSTTVPNYQTLARSFKPGMKVYSFFGGSSDKAGTVLAVFPAIGMVDVQFPHGSARYPAEDLVINTDADIKPLKTDSVPGGLSTIPVSSGQSMSKKAIYWADKDRKYKMCKKEDHPSCPRCPDSVSLKKVIYKRNEGRSERLLCCPDCLFLIKTSDILGFNL
jgi:hypothetical protein